MSKARHIGVIFALSVLSACAGPPPQTKQAQIHLTGRQNYCLGNVASLGTGLVQSPGSVKTKYSPPRLKRWTGWVRASASGKYQFSLPASGGRIILNQQQIFVHSASSSKPEVSGMELLANRFYAITVEAPNSVDSAVPLQWRRPDGRHEQVPKAYLYAPVATSEPTRST